MNEQNFQFFFFQSIFREFETRSCAYQCHGAIYNKNKIEDFKTCDKQALMLDEGKLIWDDIVSGACLENPSLLSRFFILSFGVRVNHHLTCPTFL